MRSVHHFIVGPDNHGVTRHALSLAAATLAPPYEITRIESFRQVLLPDAPIHITFTDHLFTASAEDTPLQAVDNVLDLVGDRPLSVSLHDIPQREEGASRYARRMPAYRRLVDAATLAVVNSDHEASALPGAKVIRLPIPRINSPYQPEPGTVGVVGFLYPGKGHEDILDALRGSDFTVRFLGQVSAGHENWADELIESTKENGPATTVTGWLSDAELAAEMGRIAVPICPHRHFSASGSLMTWLGAGRRVLVRDSEYAREIDEWLPGRLTLLPSHPTDGTWRDAVEEFARTERQLARSETGGPCEPPRYGWAEVAELWKKEWMRCGIS
ncbi:glycosyltransferase family 1 protein [Corynebacterium aquatimens]|uniref:Glycosyltransferase n=1 Tax=Corynebacterium aquatimens TaxID=1190508 RepID=A0A931E1S7_9CORY|nr:glycosyltransferase family 1 protein [Corynebacterium aquatimens]MBG6122196.1 hypothetical protein [Corynebacterium aquatimens]WJY65263.1 hypothetical protein CAQUA_02720 [Corynebacterium aquatimens]